MATFNQQGQKVGGTQFNSAGTGKVSTVFSQDGQTVSAQVNFDGEEVNKFELLGLLSNAKKAIAKNNHQNAAVFIQAAIDLVKGE